MQTPFGDPFGTQRKRSEPKDDSLSGAIGQDSSRDQENGGFRSDKSFLRRFVTIRDEAGSVERLLLGLGCVLFVLLIWWFLTKGEGDDRIINALTLPSPGETFSSFPQLWQERALSRNIVASLTRVVGGFLLAGAVAVPLGVIAGCYPRFHAFARPMSIFGRNVPIAALIPLTLFWFGIDELQKILFIFIAAVAFIFFDTTQSLRMVPGHFLDTAYTLGARTNWRRGLRRALFFGAGYAILVLLGAHWISVVGPHWLADKPFDPGIFIPSTGTIVLAHIALVAGTLLWLPIHNHQAISKVLFPLALPNIVNSLRLLFGLAFGYIVLAEVINAQLGVGKLILVSQRQGPREHIYLVLFAIAIMAFAIDRLVMFVQRRAFPYVSHGH